jgi:hypothetical protein
VVAGRHFPSWCLDNTKCDPYMCHVDTNKS